MVLSLSGMETEWETTFFFGRNTRKITQRLHPFLSFPTSTSLEKDGWMGAQ